MRSQPYVGHVDRGGRVARSHPRNVWRHLSPQRCLPKTPLAALGEQWWFGLYVVRAALDLQLHGQDLASLVHAAALGSRSVEAKGKGFTISRCR